MCWLLFKNTLCFLFDKLNNTQVKYRETKPLLGVIQTYGSASFLILNNRNERDNIQRWNELKKLNMTIACHVGGLGSIPGRRIRSTIIQRWRLGSLQIIVVELPGPCCWPHGNFCIRFMHLETRQRATNKKPGCFEPSNEEPNSIYWNRQASLR